MHTQDHLGGSTLWIDTAAAPYNQQPSGTGLSIYASLNEQPAALNLTHRLRGGDNLTTAPYEPQQSISGAPGAPTTCEPPAPHTSARAILNRLLRANCATPTIFTQCTDDITRTELCNEDHQLGIQFSNQSKQAITHTPPLLVAAPPDQNDSDSDSQNDWSFTYELPELI
jgi:hypothetical protein